MPDLLTPRRRIALAALAAGLLVVVAPWIVDTYTASILARAFFVAIAALTVDVLWGYSGVLTFGQSAFFGIGAYALAMTFTHVGFDAGGIALAFGLAVIVAGLVAALVGWLSFYHGSTPLYASVVSLVLPIVLVQLIYAGGETTGSSSGLVGFQTFDLDLETWFRLAGLATVAVAAAGYLLLHSDAGRILAALRDNEARCSYIGINVERLRLGILVVCAIVAALAGLGHAALGGVAAPENASFVFGTQLVIMVALGGRGTLLGAVLGALGIELASAYLSGSLPFIWELIVGIAFVAVIVLFPAGLIGALRRLIPGDRADAAPRLQTAAPLPRADRDMMVEARGVTRQFGSLAVLNGVSFSARRGELVSLVGPNGAGKTTLIRCLADGLERTGGEISIVGRPIGRLPPHRLVAFGLGRKFQAASVFNTLTVADCLRIARSRRDPMSWFDRSPVLSLPQAARQVIEGGGLGDRLGDVAGDLSHGLKQALELAMVLALEPDVVLLDEPTAGLTRAERSAFGAILTDLVRREGLCVLLVEHDLDFVREISSRIIVLHQGQIALDGTVEQVVNAPLVHEIYTGGHVPTAETAS
ncbi:MAG: ATP-binding cassette domain-containing protein [Alphaproteobacteria bacterium]|nr:ATP-binding cassette domain-containing protein [Alphaproteobacteria bacterium]